jgi:heme/copper-type cytochrome/quinol oxidase subunit 2
MFGVVYCVYNITLEETFMEEIIEWINKHKIIAFIILVNFVIVPALFCHIIYKFNAPGKWLDGEFTAGELLGYMGSALSFIGTIILGFIAIKQNAELKDLTRHQNGTNDKMMELTDKAYKVSADMLEIEKEKMLPVVSIDMENSKAYTSDRGNFIKLFFKNETEVKIFKCEIELESDTIISNQIEKLGLSLADWDVPRSCKFDSSDKTHEEFNVTWELDLIKDIYFLFVKVKLYISNGDPKEQHFKIVAMKDKLAFSESILP